MQSEPLIHLWEPTKLHRIACNRYHKTTLRTVLNPGDVTCRMCQRAGGEPTPEKTANALMDEALDALTPPYADGRPMGPLDQLTHLATNTSVPPGMAITRLRRPRAEGT